MPFIGMVNLILQKIDVAGLFEDKPGENFNWIFYSFDFQKDKDSLCRNIQMSVRMYRYANSIPFILM